MAHPVGNQGVPIQYNFAIVEGALRRELKGFLLEANRMLNTSPLQDPLTLELKNWQQRFSQRIGQDADVQSAQRAFILALQEILLDPIEYIKDRDSKVTLEAPVLGSDGITYAAKSLAICLSQLPEPYRHRSPLYFQEEAVFVTQPHPVAEYMVRWLQEKNALIVSAQVEADYQQLINENRLPALPTPETAARDEKARVRKEKIRILMERQAQKNALEAEELARFEQELLQRQIQVIQDNLVAPMRERIEAFAQEQEARVDRLEQNDQRRLQQVRERVDQFHNNIRRLEEQNEELEAQLIRLDGENQALQREAIQLQIEINHTRQAIEERKAGWLGSLLGAVAIVGICVFATWAIGAALPGGATGAVMPQVGGAKIGLVIAF
jgi:hypothetical protein